MAVGTRTAITAGTYIERSTARSVQPWTLRSSTALTTGYVATGWAETGNAERINVRFGLTWADSTSVSYTYWWSADAVTWYIASNVATSAGASTITAQENTRTQGASATWCDTLYVVDAFFRVEVKKTGGSGGDAVAVFATALGL